MNVNAVQCRHSQARRAVRTQNCTNATPRLRDGCRLRRQSTVIQAKGHQNARNGETNSQVRRHAGIRQAEPLAYASAATLRAVVGRSTRREHATPYRFRRHMSPAPRRLQRSVRALRRRHRPHPQSPPRTAECCPSSRDSSTQMSQLARQHSQRRPRLVFVVPRQSVVFAAVLSVYGGNAPLPRRATVCRRRRARAICCSAI